MLGVPALRLLARASIYIRNAICTSVFLGQVSEELLGAVPSLQLSILPTDTLSLPRYVPEVGSKLTAKQ
jgi:hypothetical protein